MLRVLKPDGYLFLIAPSAGPIHRYPVDCYRFNPDSYRALAKLANCRLVEAWLDERGPWHDLVGVFTKHALPLLSSTDGTPCAPAPFDPSHTPCGTAAEEATRGSVHYLEVLEDLHRTLRPSLYLEIGVRQGRSLALAQGPAIGVDPAPDVVAAHLGPETRVFSMTSDDYFAEVGVRVSPQPPALVFIDGMHLFEYALRDFMNVERLATAATVVVIDDIYPSHPTQALRQRRSRVWTGDIWKLHRCLAEVRPDLFLLPLDAAPAGRLLVAALDPLSRVLWDRYNPIVRQYGAAMPPPPEVLSRSDASAPADRRVADVLAVLSQARGAVRDDLLPLLRTALAAGASA